MGRRRCRTTVLLILSGACGISTAAVTIAALAALMAGYDMGGVSPWLDPLDVANWIMLACSSVAAIGFALLAEYGEVRQDALADAGSPDLALADVPSAPAAIPATVPMPEIPSAEAELPRAA